MNIILKNIGKTYHQKAIFEKVNFEIISGFQYGITGLNGSGKSTLLKIISGFITPNSGTIHHYYKDKELSVEAIFNYISYAAPYIDIPMDLKLYSLFDFHFSMRDRWNKLSNEDINTYFHLPTNIPIYQYSSGMIQRVKLALALFTDTPLVLLDEPTETLDDNGVQLFHMLLNTLAKNRTTIIASNNRDDLVNCNDKLNIDKFKS